MHQIDKKLIVFPTSRTIRNYVKTQKESNTFLPTFLTIDEFLKKSLSIGNRKYIDEEERFLYLKEASNIKSLEKLGISNDFLSFIKQSDYLFRFFGELSSEKVNIDDLETSDTYEFYYEHIEILKTIYLNYNNILDKNLAVDKINITKHSSINIDFISKYDSIEIYYEGYFTRFEFDTILEISSKIKTIIHFTYNKYNIKSCQDIKNLGIDIKLDNSYKIDLGKRAILDEKKYESKNETIEIASFISRINQIAFIKESITKIVKSGIEPENIALIVPDESFVKSLQLFDNENYFNYAMGKDILNSSFYKVISSIYNLFNEEEKKSLESVEFYNIDKIFLSKFKSHWNKKVSKEIFEEFISILLTFESNSEIKLKVDELLYKYYNLLFKKEQNLSFKESLKIFIQKISKITLDDVNSGAITVMGLLESRAVSFDAIIICDFNESFIPKKSVKDKFLSSNIKKKAKLPIASDRENLQKYYYYKLINGAKKLFISYTQNENMQISRFANELFENKIEIIPRDKEYKHILFLNKKINHYDENIVEKIDLSKRAWSASSLKDYLQCRRKFYLKHIVGIKEHSNSLKAKPYELGNIVHNTLEELYSSTEFDLVDYKKLLTIFEKNIINNPFLILDVEIFKRKLEEFVNYEKNRLDKNIKVIACEKAFEFKYKDIKLKGTIDRIDKIEDKTYVIDYKTSSSLSVDTIKNYESSSDFQLEFYFLACKEYFKYENIKTFYYDLYSVKLIEEIALYEKLELLDSIFDELKTVKEVSFDKCEKESDCQFCDFRTICNR